LSDQDLPKMPCHSVSTLGEKRADLHHIEKTALPITIQDTRAGGSFPRKQPSWPFRAMAEVM